MDRLLMMTDLGMALTDTEAAAYPFKGEFNLSVHFGTEEFELAPLKDVYDLMGNHEMNRRSRKEGAPLVTYPFLTESLLIEALTEFPLDEGEARKVIDWYVKHHLLEVVGVQLVEDTHEIILNKFITVTGELHEDSLFTADKGAILYINGITARVDGEYESAMVYCTWDQPQRMLRAKYFDNEHGPTKVQGLQIDIYE